MFPVSITTLPLQHTFTLFAFKMLLLYYLPTMCQPGSREGRESKVRKKSCLRQKANLRQVPWCPAKPCAALLPVLLPLVSDRAVAQGQRCNFP